MINRSVFRDRVKLDRPKLINLINLGILIADTNNILLVTEFDLAIIFHPFSPP